MSPDNLIPSMQALTPANATLLLAVGVATAALLAHALRKVRSHDWVVSGGWLLGGALAVGTGLWLLQLLAWGFADPASKLWFAPLPFIAAWVAAAAGVAMALLVSRWLPSHREVNPTLLVLLLPTLIVVFVVLGAALSQPPRWDRLATRPTLAALGIAAAGLLQLLLGAARAPRGRPRRRSVLLGEANADA